MSLLKKAGQLLKLGVFVGAGTAVALVAACSSSAKRIDTGAGSDATRDSAVVDRGAVDGGVEDASARDVGELEDAGSRDKRTWDIPLE